jgi:hypothetical protein
MKRGRWRDVLEGLLRRVDPHFAEPIYLVSRREAAAAGILEMHDFAGLTSIAMSGSLRFLLKRQGRWKGRGFAAIVDVAGNMSAAALEAVALHELAHYVDGISEVQGLANVVGQAAFDAKLSESVGLWTEKPGPTRAESCRQHGARFIRLAIHAEIRAALIGKHCCVVDPTLYGWPPYWQWRRSLGDEPARLAGWPLISVAAMAPPISFEEFTAAAVAAAQSPSFCSKKDP